MMKEKTMENEKTVEKVFSFPEYSISIKASNLKEAQKKLFSKIKSQ